MDNFRDKVNNAAKALEVARDGFLEASRDCALSTSSEEGAYAQSFLAMARQVEELRREALKVSTQGPRVVRIRTRFPVRSGEFPRFEIVENALVKTGLSKDGTTYQHAVARDTFEGIIAGLREFAAQSESFETERVVGRMSVPMYQVYIVIGILRKLGMIKLVKRGTFKFSDGFIQESKGIWDQLKNNELE
ncbi:MAG: hypothetical protein PCFJNLEI_03228 [Verrucomicrobiae bacterium]|nr:hypothetical protein [Verrucomicrobiae bacterium]